MPAAPSLLIVPYRSKTGKLYSQIPTSGAGDFTVTRNTEARRFNSAGLIASVASGIPRLDYYTSGGTAGCPALLVEPSGTNLALQSTFSTGWGTSFSGSVSGNASGTNSPEGSGNAALLSVVATAFSSISRTITTVSGSVYAASVFAKKRDKDFLYFVNLAGNTAIAWFNLASGTVGTVGANTTARIENYGNGWYRCSITQTAGGTTSYIQFGLSDADNTNAAASSGSNFVFGAQFELGSVATSYIPTTTGTGSRSADVISVSGAVSGSIGQTEGVLYIECESNNGEDDVFNINRSAANAITVYKNANNSYLGRIYHSSTSIIFTSASGVTGTVKIAIAYKSGDSTMYLNGSRVGTLNTTAITFGAALNYLGVDKSAAFFSGIKPSRIRAVALYTTRLTDAELATLTTPSDGHLPQVRLPRRGHR